ncbi:MAG: cytochrome c biogenesis protein ResB [Verrucomicrobiota bacterium]
MKAIIQFLVSLKLTVILLCFSVVLVFFGTLDQVETGIHLTQKKYFESFFVVWYWPDTFPWQDYLGSFALPMPGGYLVGGLLLINLVAAHIHRFKFTLQKFGIQLVHVGLILLLFSELFTDILSVEVMMTIPEGEASNDGINARESELAFIKDLENGKQKVVTIDTEHLKNGDQFSHGDLPFDVEIVRFYENSAIRIRGADTSPPISLATIGLGKVNNRPSDIVVLPARPVYSMENINKPAAFIRLTDSESEEDLGTWLVAHVLAGHYPIQTLDINGETWSLDLRLMTNHFPFSLELIDFRFDRYPGTEIPKNFSSEVVIKDPGNNVERKALIYMNHPLRYGGFTFFQASFDEETETNTVLQVVKNPGWLLPYISVALMGFGMTWQFMSHLFKFLNKRTSREAAA